MYEACPESESYVWLSCCENFFSKSWQHQIVVEGLLNPTSTADPRHFQNLSRSVRFVKNVNKKFHQVRNVRCHKVPLSSLTS